MIDPVVLLGDGRSYEQAAIKHFLATGPRVSPSTGEPLGSLGLVPNHALRCILAAHTPQVIRASPPA